MPTETRYTFGDGDVAALRLRLLAETYAPSSAALLAALGEVRGGVLDLGCGPGHTTELLAAALRPTWTVGLDRSARLVEAARARLPALRFLVHDVMAAPFPAAPAAVVYARFLLTHLSDPVAALRGWGGALAPGGRLVLEETASLESDHPAFRRYYALVEALQAHYGQGMRVGAELAALAAAAGLTPERSGVVVLELPPERMAALHALNLRTCGPTDSRADLTSGTRKLVAQLRRRPPRRPLALTSSWPNLPRPGREGPSPRTPRPILSGTRQAGPRPRQPDPVRISG